MSIFIFALLLLVFGSSILLFYSITNLLVTNDKLKKVDVIIVISGDKGERLQHAVDLFQKKYAHYLLVSGCQHPEHVNSYAPAMQEQAVSLGVPHEKIIMDPANNTSTGNQAISISKLMKEKNFQSAILVTSNYHTGRSKMIFQRACQSDNIKILLSHPIMNQFDFDGWWKSSLGRRLVICELVKLGWYGLFFPGNQA